MVLTTSLAALNAAIEQARSAPDLSAVSFEVDPLMPADLPGAARMVYDVTQTRYVEGYAPTSPGKHCGCCKVPVHGELTPHGAHLICADCVDLIASPSCPRAWRVAA